MLTGHSGLTAERCESLRQLLVRYGEIGSKSYNVKKRMVQTLRQRVADRLSYEGIGFRKVSVKDGRVIARGLDASEAAEHISELPGVSTVSPAERCEKDLEAIKQAASGLEVGESFGVETKRSVDTDFDSMDVNREVGSKIESGTGAEVELESPDTWIRVEVREQDAYVFTEKIRGPDGFPAGSSGSLAALVSGGIDSPVAAYEAMTRGAEITPIYFYNKPLAAEDHLLRFEQVIKKLRRFNPSKGWHYFLVDMEKINQELLEEVDRGRMLLHRRVMFEVAEKIAVEEGLQGILTGESIGQKSSQTVSNLSATSGHLSLPVHRPLLTYSKKDIVEKSRELGTYKLSEIDSACRSLSPDQPATAMSAEELSKIQKRFDMEEKVSKAVKDAKKHSV